MIDLSWFQHLSPSQQQELLQGPALKPPPGIIPDFIHPPNENRLGSDVLVTACVLNTCLAIVRLYARFFHHKKMGLEDCATIAALGAFSGFICMCWEIVKFPGLFVHQWNIRLRDLSQLLYYMNAGSALYGVVIMFLKAGILLHWASVFVPRGIRNGFWWTCHIVLAIKILFSIIYTFVQLFGCSPREKLWVPTMASTCMNMRKVNIVSAILNFISDFIILFLPQKVIWSLRLTLRKRFGVAALFAVGVFANVCAAFRIHSLVQFNRNSDFTWHASDMGMWCIAEITSGFFVLCLPVIPKVLRDSDWVTRVMRFIKISKRRKAFSGPITPPAEASKHKPQPHHLTSDFDSDEFGLVSLTNICVTSEFEVRSEFMEI